MYASLRSVNPKGHKCVFLPQPASAGVQASAVAPIKDDVAAMLLRLEGFQEMVANVACLHRVFFQRLISHARAHAAPQDTGSFAPLNSSDEADHDHALHTFLEHHFMEDALVNNLQV